jgi:hypothetical protein
VANHADYMVFVGAEMETAVAALGKTAFFSLPLGKEFGEGNAARREHTQVAVQWQDVFVGVQCLCDSDRNGFLADAAEPFSHFALAQQYEHFFFNDPGFHQGTVQVQESFITQVSALKVHAAAKVSRGGERQGWWGRSVFRGKEEISLTRMGSLRMLLACSCLALLPTVHEYDFPEAFQPRPKIQSGFIPNNRGLIHCSSRLILNYTSTSHLNRKVSQLKTYNSLCSRKIEGGLKSKQPFSQRYLADSQTLFCSNQNVLDSCEILI